jgi:hypothetical protein
MLSAVQRGKEAYWCMGREIGDRGEAAQDKRHRTSEQSDREQHAANSFDEPRSDPEIIRHLSENGECRFDVFHMRKIDQLREAVLKE